MVGKQRRGVKILVVLTLIMHFSLAGCGMKGCDTTTSSEQQPNTLLTPRNTDWLAYQGPCFLFQLPEGYKPKIRSSSSSLPPIIIEVINPAMPDRPIISIAADVKDSFRLRESGQTAFIESLSLPHEHVFREEDERGLISIATGLQLPSHIGVFYRPVGVIDPVLNPLDVVATLQLTDYVPDVFPNQLDEDIPLPFVDWMNSYPPTKYSDTACRPID